MVPAVPRRRSALDRLHARYGAQLAIIGLSVGEDRAVVEKYLKERPHKFPIALTAENDLPRHYDVAALPTYVILTPMEISTPRWRATAASMACGRG